MTLTVVHKYTYNNKIHTSKYTALNVADARQICIECAKQDKQDGFKRFSLQTFTQSGEFVGVMA
jgi:hypothetical protein